MDETILAIAKNELKHGGPHVHFLAFIWFFVKFWGAKVSMHSWRGHALKIVRVLFRCVC